MPINAVSAVQSPIKLRTSQAVAHGRHLYPHGFVRAGGVAAEDNQTPSDVEASTRAYFAKVAEEQGKHSLARKILSEDATRLSGRKKGQRWQPTGRRRPTPQDRTDIRCALLLLLSEPTFASALTPDEQSLWRLWYDPADYSVQEISAQTGAETRTLYRKHADCVKKLAICYGRLLESDADLPLPLQVVQCLYLWDTFNEGRWNSDYAEFCDIIRGADADNIKALSYCKILDEIADGTPGGLTVRAGGRKERAYGTPKDAE